MKRAALALAALALASCHRQPSRAGCERDANDLSTWLDAVYREGGAQLPWHVKLVERTAPSPTGHGIVVEVAPHETLVGGQPTEAAGFAAVLEQQPLLRGADPHVVWLAVDQQTPWSRVVEVVGWLREQQVPAATLLFVHKSALTPPPGSYLDLDLDALKSGPPADRASRLAGLVMRLIARCPAMGELYRGAAQPADKKADAIVAGTKGALLACGCQVDLAPLRQVYWRLLGPRDGQVVGAVPIALGPGDADPVGMPAATPWAVASETLLAAAAKGPVTLAVSPTN